MRQIQSWKFERIVESRSEQSDEHIRLVDDKKNDHVRNISGNQNKRRPPVVESELRMLDDRDTDKFAW